MSGDSTRHSRAPWPAERERVVDRAAALTRVLFGGRAGLALFCGSLALFVSTWRLGVFFNDIELYPLMLERVAAGHLSLGAPEQLETIYPGMHHRAGEIYGRGYGVAGFALPVLWGVELLRPLVDLRWVVVLGWSGLVLATVGLVGDLVDRRRLGLAVGGALAGVGLVANAWFYKPFVMEVGTFALQVSTMLAGAVLVVGVYRLLAHRHGATVGALGGATVLLGTPVAFWATTPKRHTLSAMFVVLAVYAFARSRSTDASDRERTAFRAGAYACAGLTAWVHAPEGFTLFAALAVVDVPTAPRNDARTLAAVGAAFALSLVPFLATNALVSGNPFLPPHFLDSYVGQSLAHSQAGAAGGGASGVGSGASGTTGGTAGSGGGAGGTSSGGWLAGAAGAVAALAGTVAAGYEAVRPLLRRGLDMYVSGFVALFTEPHRIVRTFVRWGETEREVVNMFFDGRTDLSVLESAPVLAALVALSLPFRRRVDQIRADTRRLRDAVDPVDLFVLVYAVLLVSLYINRLPVYVQATVRYLHPIYPLAVYGLFRIPRVRALLATRTREAVLGFEATVLLGAPLSFGALLASEATKGDVVQAVGLASLAVAAALAVAVLVGHRDERADRAAAAAFGAAVGVATIYLLLTSFVLFHYGPSALPAADAISGELRWLALTMD
ncbi:MAG: hypothetical protein ABEJ26_14150 [Halosimplex sp.]